MKKSKSFIYILMPIIALAFSIMSVFKHSVSFTLIAVVLVYIIVAIYPFAKDHEIIWLFLISHIVLIPQNIVIGLYIDIGFYIELNTILNTILISIIKYGLVISVEETVLCYVGRLIWKRQKQFIVSDYFD